MTQSRPPERDALDDVFEDLRATPPAMPDGLLARVTTDALREMPTATRAPLWRQVLTGIGGWPAMAGLAATACVGLWIGGVASDDLIIDYGLTQSAALDFGDTFGTFDQLMVDG